MKKQPSDRNFFPFTVLCPDQCPNVPQKLLPPGYFVSHPISAHWVVLTAISQINRRGVKRNRRASQQIARLQLLVLQMGFSASIITDPVFEEDMEMNKTRFLKCASFKERIRCGSTKDNEVNMIMKFCTKCFTCKNVELNNLLEVIVWGRLHQRDDI